MPSENVIQMARGKKAFIDYINPRQLLIKWSYKFLKVLTVPLDTKCSVNLFQSSTTLLKKLNLPIIGLYWFFCYKMRPIRDSCTAYSTEHVTLTKLDRRVVTVTANCLWYSNSGLQTHNLSPPTCVIYYWIWQEITMIVKWPQFIMLVGKKLTKHWGRIAKRKNLARFLCGDVSFAAVDCLRIQVWVLFSGMYS